jgi:Na+-exporting ATPase
MGLSFGVGDFIEGGVLAAVIILNVSIGFFQEYGAEKKMDALRSLSAPSATVLRDGKTSVISKLVTLRKTPPHPYSHVVS